MTIIGLQNIGNTCYLNSICQVILNCSHFIDFIMRINTNNEIIVLIKKFIYEYRTSTEPVTPINIKKCMSKYEKFEGFSQHDSHEFLTIFLDIIDMELKKEKIDIISIFFDHKFYTKIYNENEEKIIKSIERILHLPVTTNLNESYLKFTESENFEWKSDKFNSYVNANKKDVVYEWPIYLTILFKKYSTHHKIDNDIEIPIQWKIVNISQSKKEIINYSLVGCVIQYGNLFAGHYISILHRNNKFYLCNDANIHEIEQEKAIQIINKAYLVIYEKV